MKHKLIYIGFLGNIFEWYDFSIYAYLASVIGQLFFSSANNQLALTHAFVLFSVSYLIRPLGSVVFGALADFKGRKPVLQSTLILMAIPTVIIGLLPTPNSIGVISTISLIVLRLVQGFAAGGELPSSACYLYEKAPTNQKTFFCSFVAASSMLGVLLASLTVTSLHVLLTKTQIVNGGWRIPFLLSFILALFILYIRKGITEPYVIQNVSYKSLKTQISWKLKIKAIFQVVLLNAYISVAFYLLFVWMPSYLHVFLNVSSHIAFITNTLSLITLIGLTLFIGYFASRIGRKNLAVISIVTIMISCYPLFSLLQSQQAWIILLAQLCFALALSLIDSINMEMMSSRFDPLTRGRGVSICFTLSTALFGGLAPTLCSYLIHVTASHIAPIILLISVGLIALPAALSLEQD